MSGDIPDTQRRAWEAIKASGALTPLRWAVYDLICRRPGLNRNEIDAALAPGRSNAPYSRRLAELRDMGLIVPLETSGKATTWMATPACAVVRLEKKPRPQDAFEKIARLASDDSPLFARTALQEIRNIARQFVAKKAAA